MRRIVVIVALAALTGDAATGQGPQSLFVPRSDNAAAQVAVQGASRRTVLQRWRVGMRLERLFDATGARERVLLNIGERMWTARLERVDIDGSEHRSWVGSIETLTNSHVVFTERNGIVSGLIDAAGLTYQLTTEHPGVYILEHLDVSQLASEREPVDAPHAARTDHAAETAAADPAADVIDVLLLYTSSARGQQGGTANMQALAAQVISDTNTGFARSGITARMRLIAALEFPQAEAPEMLLDLFALRASDAARALRDAAGADLVQLLVNSTDLSSCGVGFLLESLDTTDFPAFSVADVACVPQYTPSHEMAHNLGSHHAPEDGPPMALFPYSYGYKDPARAFRTVMAYNCAGVSCPRVLNFSNPDVTYQGAVMGSPTQNNALSMNQAAPVVARFRHPVPPDARLLAPTRLRSAVTGSAVTLTWDRPPIQQRPSYVLQVGTSYGASNLLNAWVGDVTAVSGVTNFGPHYWRVIPVDDFGRGPASSEAAFEIGGFCIPPLPPSRFTFAVLGRTVTLRWTPPTIGTETIGYIVEAGSSSGLADLLTAPAGPSLSVVTDAPPGNYHVRVRAQNACGISAASNEQHIVVH